MADGSRYVSETMVAKARAAAFADGKASMRAGLEAVAGDIAAAVRREEDASVTRFEVVDHTPMTGEGRVLVRYDVAVERSYQDAGQTLKVFLKDREAPP